MDITRYVIMLLRSMGYTVLFVRVDEDGALAKSTEFCNLIKDLTCLLETTGGGNSSNNDISERSNYTRADMMRSQLTVMHLMFGRHLPEGIEINMFWCFAYSMAAFIQRRIYNRSHGDVPYFLVHKSRPSLNECIIPGSIMTIVNPNKHLGKKLANDRAIKGYFLGFSNHSSICLYFDPAHPRQLKQSAHCIIEDVATMHALQSVIVSPLHTTPSVPPSTVPKEITSSIAATKLFNTRNLQFPGKKVVTVKFCLPPFPQEIGISFGYDNHFHIPFIKRIVPGSFAYEFFPPGVRRNYFVVGVNAESPITVGYTVDKLQQIQRTKSRMVSIDLIHRSDNNTATGIAELRAMFDALPSILANRPLIASIYDSPDQPLHFVSASSKPPTPKSYFDALKSTYSHNWKAAAFNQFLKNHNIAVFSLPFPSTDLPKGAKVFRSQLVTEVKSTDMSGIWELKIRHVIVGTPQSRKHDFDESYSPTIDPTTL